MTVATRLSAAVDVAQESTIRRVIDGSAPVLSIEPGLPVRVAALVGRDPSYAKAVRAGVLAAGAELVHVATTQDRRTFVEHASALRETRPDAVVIAGDGGDAAGMGDLVEALSYGTAARPPARLLLAGEARLHERISAARRGMAGEALPDLRAADGRLALVARLRGLRRRAEPVVLRDEAVEGAARALAATGAGDALVVDVHGSSTSLARVTKSGELTAVHTRLGVGGGADRVVAGPGLERVRRWMPRPIDGPALLERVFNRARWPDAAPATPLSLMLEMALAREVIARALEEAARAGIDVAALRGADTIACTGRLARFPRAAQSVLALIDGLGGRGVASVLRERPDELIAMGALAARGSEVDITPSIELVAAAVMLEPRRAATVRVADDSGAVEEQAGRGAFLLLPTSGPVEVRTGQLRATTAPLALGVVIDARGRPLTLPPRDAERLPTLARWLRALAAVPEEQP